MPRPHKKRKVSGIPSSHYFKPAGILKSNLQQSDLTIEEFEAIRLKDFKGLDQKECAELMEISQPTFHRLIVVARRKVADAIINGKAILINKKDEE